MLLAVEGGGFFSSSASGYSKGLTLLLLGQENEDKPMRVSPWNQYQLVDQESDPDLQLASTKNCLASRCASFACFRRASAGHDTPSPLKVGPAQQQDNLPGPLVSVSGKDPSVLLDDDNNKRKVALKSSLKKRPVNFPVAVDVSHEHEPSGGKENNSPGQMERRKVQWTDACGSEIAEIREFEPSDVNGSDDEFDNGNERSCSCAIIKGASILVHERARRFLPTVCQIDHLIVSSC